MKKQFIERIKKEKVVDTKNYRYVYDDFNKTIERLPIRMLGTIDAIDSFEIILVGV